MIKKFNEFIKESVTDLRTLVKSMSLKDFLKSIITDHDTRYTNRKYADFLIQIEPTSYILSIKPEQDISESIVKLWMETIEEDRIYPPIIIRNNGEMDGHHKLEAYRRLDYDEVPVIYEQDLIDFYNDNLINERQTITPGLEASIIPFANFNNLFQTNKDEAPFALGGSETRQDAYGNREKAYAKYIEDKYKIEKKEKKRKKKKKVDK